MSTPQCSYKDCKHPVYRGGTECIFHAQEKDPQEFRNALAAQIRQWRNERAKTWDFRRWVFVDVERKGKFGSRLTNLFCNGVFPRGVSFFSATFTNSGNFSGARFFHDAAFSGTTFLSDADFSGAQYFGKADFFWSFFDGNADFCGAVFRKQVRFPFTWFFTKLYFCDAVFIDGADFRDTYFLGKIHFGNAKFYKGADFTNAILPVPRFIPPEPMMFKHSE